MQIRSLGLAKRTAVREPDTMGEDGPLLPLLLAFHDQAEARLLIALVRRELAAH